MVALKKSGRGCGEKLIGVNLLFPSLRALNFSNSTAFSAKNTWRGLQERKQQQQEAEQIGSGILTGDMGIGCDFNSSFNWPGPNLS